MQEERGTVGGTHCPLCGAEYLMKKAKRRRQAKEADDGRIPRELKDLELYAADRRLCLRWERLFVSWKAAFPGLDVLKEVRTAHAWEVSNPQRAKRDRPRFLQNWLSRQSDRPRVPWVKGGDRIAPEWQPEASERESLISEILGEGKRREPRIGMPVPYHGKTYTLQPQGLLYEGDHRILAWIQLNTEQLREILRVAELYQHAGEVF